MSDQHILQTPQEMMRNKFVEDASGTHVVDGDGRIVRQVVLDGVERTIATQPWDGADDLNGSLRDEILRVLNAADEIGLRVGSVTGLRHGAASTTQVQVHGVGIGSISTAEAVALIDTWSFGGIQIGREHYAHPAAADFTTVSARDNGVTLKVFAEYSADLGSDVDDTTGGEA